MRTEGRSVACWRKSLTPKDERTLLRREETDASTPKADTNTETCDERIPPRTDAKKKVKERENNARKKAHVLIHECFA